ncbi:MAG: hypothetical protein HRT88_05130 [Lentisphaeraceae bacterium]|nr:hypothetical protein [Lentisphaeraceae bacterium]
MMDDTYQAVDLELEKESCNPYDVSTACVTSCPLSRGDYFIDGDYLACREKLTLPKLCIKTGELVDESSHLQKKVMYWIPPWVIASLLVTGFLFVYLYIVKRKKVVVSYYLTPALTLKYNLVQYISYTGILCCLALLLFGVGIKFGLLLCLIMLLFIVFNKVYGFQLKVSKFEDGYFYISGFSQGYLDALDGNHISDEPSACSEAVVTHNVI